MTAARESTARAPRDGSDASRPRSLQPSLVRRLGRRLPRTLQVAARITRGLLRRELALSWASPGFPRDVFEIELAGELGSIRTRCRYRRLLIERAQHPAVSSFDDSSTLIGLGVLPEGASEPEAYAVRFRGVRLGFIPRSGVWPPCLDSYLIIADLIDSWPGPGQRFWEVGCGTGVIGLHLLRLVPCEEGLLTDVDPRAVEHAGRNAEALQIVNATIRAEAFPPPAPETAEYDLLVSNPPYFPRGFMGLQAFERQATDDLELTKALLEFGPRYAKRVVIGLSSVLLGELTGSFERLRAGGIASRMLSRHRLPLTVPGLRVTGTLPDGVFRDGPHPRFDLWHDFHVCEFRLDDVRQRSGAPTP